MDHLSNVSEMFLETIFSLGGGNPPPNPLLKVLEPQKPEIQVLDLDSRVLEPDLMLTA